MALAPNGFPCILQISSFHNVLYLQIPIGFGIVKKNRLVDMLQLDRYVFLFPFIHLCNERNNLFFARLQNCSMHIHEQRNTNCDVENESENYSQVSLMFVYCVKLEWSFIFYYTNCFMHSYIVPEAFSHLTQVIV